MTSSDNPPAVRTVRRVLSGPMFGNGPGEGLELDESGQPIRHLSRVGPHTCPRSLASAPNLRERLAKLQRDQAAIRGAIATLKARNTDLLGKVTIARWKATEARRASLPEPARIDIDAMGNVSGDMTIPASRPGPAAAKQAGEIFAEEPRRVVIRHGTVFGDK